MTPGHEAPAGTSFGTRTVMFTNSASEVEAEADGGIDRGSLQEAVCETIRHLRPHDACMSVEALGKSVVRDEGNRIQLSTALPQAGIRTMRRVQSSGCPALEAVLLFVIIGNT